MTTTRTLITGISGFLFICCVFIQSQSAQQCGKIMTRPNSAKLQAKIIGGYEVGYFKYPWFAALQIDDDTFCGGALIGPSIVLTAAHCYNDARGRNLENYYQVKLGIYRQCRKEPTQKNYKVSKVWIHEKYKDNDPYYDIALLRLAGDTTPYMPICLPPKILSDIEQELEGWIVGFGTTVEGNENSYPCEMHEGRILLYNNATCRAMVKRQTTDIKYVRFIKALCAGYQSGGVDTCQGDSGGPLMTFNSLRNTWQTVGVTAFGWGCGEKNQMGVYTDVSRFLDWIELKSGITPSDYQNSSDNKDEPPQNNQNQNPSTSNDIANTFISVFDHVMNSPHRPVEITIRFKNKPHADNKSRGEITKPKHKRKVKTKKH
ncbi:serine protease 30-like [Atheta coriaria]|uniref:serine protease 30-like n=1 Tax=Dalotia coriaria TaxID=877792 RepID=UPI0031F41355